MTGKRKAFNCIYMYCVQPVSGRHHVSASKNEYTHDVKAGLSLRCVHMGFFVLLIHVPFYLENRAACK